MPTSHQRDKPAEKVEKARQVAVERLACCLAESLDIGIFAASIKADVYVEFILDVFGDEGVSLVPLDSSRL